MKRLIKIIKLLLLPLLIISLNSCAMHFNVDEVDGVIYGYSKSDNTAFISLIDWNLDKGNEIVIPNYYNDIPIKQLGGYYGRGVPYPFFVNLDINSVFGDANDCFSTYSDLLEDVVGSRYEHYFVSNVCFYVTLPDYLKEITNVRGDRVLVGVYSVEGNDVAFVCEITYHFTINSENKYFYTEEDGRLYEKKWGRLELVDDFLYNANFQEYYC